jgi:hypothetical protein
VTIVNAEGPFEPTDDAPAVVLVVRDLFGGKYVHAEPVVPAGTAKPWFMHGGTYIETSDSRFGEAIRRLTGNKHAYPVALHDRTETAEEMRRNSI